jgi:hypothetical protein
LFRLLILWVRLRYGRVAWRQRLRCWLWFLQVRPGNELARGESIFGKLLSLLGLLSKRKGRHRQEKASAPIRHSIHKYTSPKDEAASKPMRVHVMAHHFSMT